jgi:hypothetical protein
MAISLSDDVYGGVSPLASDNSSKPYQIGMIIDSILSTSSQKIYILILNPLWIKDILAQLRQRCP